jgi:hypothetical protein
MSWPRYPGLLTRFRRRSEEPTILAPPDVDEDDSSGCEHPADGVMWNPWNKVVQCHRCGAQIDGEV